MEPEPICKCIHQFDTMLTPLQAHARRLAVDRQASKNQSALSMPVEITQAPGSFSRWDELLKLIHEAFPFQHARIDPPSSLHRLDPASLAAKAREETLFLALAQQEIVGCVFAKLKGTYLYIGKFAVSRQHQGQGIGRRLLQAVEALAKKSGLDVVELETFMRIRAAENQ